MSNPFPVTSSIPSPDAIRDLVLPNYPIGAPVQCRLFMSGVNDVYHVRTEVAQYILKVYRSSWRRESDVLYELDLLAHLSRKGVSVSRPVPRQDGRLIYPLPAPEGIRQTVLFEHAPGRPPKWPFFEEMADSELLGGVLADIHNAGDDFASPHPRRELNEEFLLDGTLAVVRPFLAHRPEDWRYLQEFTERLRQRLRRLAEQGLSWGVCHGDYHGGNVFIDDDRTATVYDFDVCGAGWHAFDLARWRADTAGKPGNSWEEFLSGYQKRRPPREVDQEAVPLFTILRTFDWMRIKSTLARNGEFDCWDMDFYFNDTLAAFKARESEILGEVSP